MDEVMKEELTKNEGLLISLRDYEVRVGFDEGTRYRVNAAFYKKEKTRTGDVVRFTDEEIETLIEDLKDLSDWRHYRLLMKKLNEEGVK